MNTVETRSECSKEKQEDFVKEGKSRVYVCHVVFIISILYILSLNNFERFSKKFTRDVTIEDLICYINQNKNIDNDLYCNSNEFLNIYSLTKACMNSSLTILKRKQSNSIGVC